MYRPYKSKEEMFYKGNPLIIFIKQKNSDNVSLITDFLKSSVIVNGTELSFQQLFNEFESINGLPCGVEEDN